MKPRPALHQATGLLQFNQNCDYETVPGVILFNLQPTNLLCYYSMDAVMDVALSKVDPPQPNSINPQVQSRGRCSFFPSSRSSCILEALDRLTEGSRPRLEHIVPIVLSGAEAWYRSRPAGAGDNPALMHLLTANGPGML